ncbi:MAG: fibronectin type III domain-containing protein [Myxococcota bacterium]
MKSRSVSSVSRGALCAGLGLSLLATGWTAGAKQDTPPQQQQRQSLEAVPMRPTDPAQQVNSGSPRHAPLHLLLQRPGIEEGLRSLRTRNSASSWRNLPTLQDSWHSTRPTQRPPIASQHRFWPPELSDGTAFWPPSWSPLSQTHFVQQTPPPPSFWAPPDLSAAPDAALLAPEVWRDRAPTTSAVGGNAGAGFKVGDKRTFNVYNFASSAYETIPTTLVQEGNLVKIWVAESQYGATKVGDGVVAAIKAALEDSTPSGSYDPSRGILEVEQALFGLPPDLEKTGKLNVVITDIQDGWSASCACAYTAGFFDPNDLVASNPSSNGADILYLDAYPSLYTEKGAADATPALATAAHEYQHLIHANNGNLYLFQNEGQSEWAQGVTGYPVRTIRYLDEPGATNTSLYRWSSGTTVAQDYQRASLFHAYLAGLSGTEALASITRSELGGWDAYAPALAPSARADVLSGFHVANWVNDPKLGASYAYADDAHAGLRMSAPTLELTGSTVSRMERQLAYGGAEYLRWRGVKDLELTLELADGMKVMAIQKTGDTRNIRLVLEGTTFFSGSYDEIVLVVATVEPLTSAGLATTELSASAQTYAFSGRWTPTDLVTEELAYTDVNTLFYYASLPYNTETAGAVRFTPSVSGAVQRVTLGLTTFLNGAANPKGSGSVRLAFTDAVLSSGSGSSAVIVPGTERGSLLVPFTSLSSGLNTIDVSAQNWKVTAGTDFFVQVNVESPSGDGGISLDLDSGSTDTSDLAYYPARTRRYNSSTTNWNTTWLNNGNIDIRVSVTGQFAEPPGAVTLKSPADTSTGWLSPLVVLWQETPGAQRYQLQLSERADFNPLLDEQELLSPQAVLEGLEPGQQYHYRIRASNSAGFSAWTAASFEMLAPPSGEYTLEYVDEANKIWLAALPFYSETQASVRFSTLVESDVLSLTLELSDKVNDLPNPQGTGTLKLSLHPALLTSGSGLSAVYTPGVELGSIETPFSALKPGEQLFEPTDWRVGPGEYMVVMQVLNPSQDAAVGIVFDNGSSELSNQEYYPARSRRYIQGYGEWNNTWFNNGNFALAMTLESFTTATPTPEPETPTPALETPTLAPEESPSPTSPPTSTPAQTPAPTPEVTPTGTEPPDSPTPSDGDAGGCACHTSGQESSTPVIWAVATLLWWVKRRRKAGC